ncbi:MAG: DsrE family protein [bacterium]
MNRLRIPLIPTLAVSVLLTASKVLTPETALAQQPAQSVHKVAILMLNYPSLPGGSIANMNRAMSYALQLKKAGVEVAVMFDGPGILWMSVILPGDGKAGSGKLKLQDGQWTPPPGEKMKLISMRKACSEAGIRMMASPGAARRRGWEEELSPGKLEKARSSETGELDIAAYVLDGYQVWIF